MIADWHDELNKAVPASEIKTTQGNAYVRGHYAIRTANRIFGPLSWGLDILDTVLVQDEVKKGSKGTEQCYISYTMTVRLTVTGDGVSKTTEDAGFGQGINQDRGLAHEKAIKGARTDALKRCLKDLGDAFGLHLYDDGSRTVPEDPSAPQPPKAQPLKPADFARLKEAINGSSFTAKEKRALNEHLIERFAGDGSQSAEALAWAMDQIGAEHQEVKR